MGCFTRGMSNPFAGSSETNSWSLTRLLRSLHLGEAAASLCDGEDTRIRRVLQEALKSGPRSDVHVRASHIQC